MADLAFTKRLIRRWPLILVLALVALALARLLEAAFGFISLLRAVSEAALVVSIISVSAPGARFLRHQSRVVSILAGVALVIWGAFVILPLWRAGHPRQPLYDGVLGGATREAKLVVDRGGRFELLLGIPRAADGEPHDTSYALQVGLKSGTYRLDGFLTNTDREVAELQLERGETLTLFFERMPRKVALQIRPKPMPILATRLGALLAALLAAAVELFAPSAAPRVRGLFTAGVGASALFVSLLDPAGGGRAAIGMAVVSILGAAVWSALIGLARRYVPRRI